MSCWLRFVTISLIIHCSPGSSISHAQDSPWLHLPDSIRPNTQLSDLRNGAFVFRSPEDAEIVSDSVVRWGNWQGVVGQQAVWLSDGSWLAGQILSVDESSVLIRNRWLNLESIPFGAVRAIVYSPAASFAEWNSMSDQLSSLEGENDTVILRDGSQLTGVIDLSTIDESSPQSFAIQVGQERVNLPWTNLATIAISPALFEPTQLDSATIAIGLDDGSLLQVNELTTSRQHVALETPSLGEIKSHDAAHGFVRAIRYLNRARIPNVVRLDSLEPVDYRFIPDSELIFQLGRNRSVFDTPLVVGRRSDAGMVNHGLALHSSSQTAFRWDQSAGKFLAEVCIAQQYDGELEFGDSICKVLLGKGRDLTLAVEFELSRKEHPMAHQTVDVDLAGAQLVVLVVEKAGFGQWGDQVFWLDARFFKQPNEQ